MEEKLVKRDLDVESGYEMRVLAMVGISLCDYLHKIPLLAKTVVHPDTVTGQRKA